MFTIDLHEIVDLATSVATTGALRIAENSGDDVFEMIIAVGVVVYQSAI